jgi:replicative DNA helicase
MSSERRAEAEQALVSAVLGRQPTRIEMEDILSSVPAGGVKSLGLSSVWDAMAKVHKAGAEVNILTVYDQMSADVQGRIADLPVQAVHLAEMSTTMYATAHGVAHWLAVVEKLNKVDDLKGKLVKGLADADAYEVDPDSLAQSLIHSLEGGQEKVQHVTMAPLLQSIIADVESGTGAKPMPTPWANLNAVLKGGAAPGELVVLAARPGMGKTALAGCWAVETARNFGPVLFVSCEVKDKTLGSRMLAREGRIDNRAFREGLGNSMTLLPKMRNAADRLADLPLSIMDSSCRAVRPAEVRKWARKLGKPAMIVVDYLQLMYPDEKHDSREREIADMSRSMKRLAVEMGCPVLLLSQLNRKIEEGNREPQLSDLRESGAIEQDADIVIMLHADRRVLSEKDVPLQALVRKGRSSGTGAADLLFEKPFSDFRVNDGYRPDFNRSQPYDL